MIIGLSGETKTCSRCREEKPVVLRRLIKYVEEHQ